MKVWKAAAAAVSRALNRRKHRKRGHEMLQDIAPLRLDNTFFIIKPDEDSYVVIRDGQAVIALAVNGEITLPTFKEVDDELRGSAAGSVNAFGQPEEYSSPEMTYLISVGDRKFFMPAESDMQRCCEALFRLGYDFTAAKQLRYCGPNWLRYGALVSWQLGAWYKNNTFCGRCGKPMVKSDKERMVHCAECGNIVYPKLCPVVIVGIVWKDRILLTKYADSSRARNLALVAGFAEIGETIEETVAREVMEETSLKVKNLHYYKSQPWPYSDSLLFGFFCEVDGSEEFHVDEFELSRAVWTAPEDITLEPEEVSLTNEMKKMFKEHGRKVLDM